MMILSFAFSLRLSWVTSSETEAPDGMMAPLEPATPSATVAVKGWPTVKVLVQTRSLERRLSVVPEAMVHTEPPPLAPAEPLGLRVTVLPDGVVVVVGGGAGRGAGRETVG